MSVVDCKSFCDNLRHPFRSFSPRTTSRPKEKGRLDLIRRRYRLLGRLGFEVEHFTLHQSISMRSATHGSLQPFARFREVDQQRRRVLTVQPAWTLAVSFQYYCPTFSPNSHDRFEGRSTFFSDNTAQLNVSGVEQLHHHASDQTSAHDLATSDNSPRLEARLPVPPFDPGRQFFNSKRFTHDANSSPERTYPASPRTNSSHTSQLRSEP